MLWYYTISVDLLQNKFTGYAKMEMQNTVFLFAWPTFWVHRFLRKAFDGLKRWKKMEMEDDCNILLREREEKKKSSVCI